MAVDSITRPMVLTEEGCLRLIEAMNEQQNEPIIQAKKTNFYEEGVKFFEDFFAKEK